jgi:hypothetical protein
MIIFLCVFQVRVKVKGKVPLLKHHGKKTWAIEYTALRSLNLGIRCCGVSFALRLLYPRGKKPRYRLDMRLGGSRIQPNCGRKERSAAPVF